ncbi:MAG: phenylalanine--tRNA ligase subunit beta [Candidatus Sumerlaeia bacterium]
MRISYRWLRDYLPVNVSAPDVVDILTMNGIEVESELDLGAISGKILVARITAIRPHPNAEKLRLATVDYGKGTPLEVVCGAPNIEVGQKVPLALEGAKLPNGVELRRAMIRGVESEGMLCSAAELGVSDDAEGIWILPDDVREGREEFKVGEPVDLLFDISITPNRPDCLSLIGLAREVAVHFKREVFLPQKRLNETLDRVDSFVRVTVKAPHQCPRYTCRVIKGVRIGPSPAWMRYRLETAGLRSINNVVDVTNFVMLEYGQPLHAFDLDRIFNHHIIVRLAEEGEKIQTLDDKTFVLSRNDLTIADYSRPIALAGIMGGKNSEVTESVFNVLIESAYFDPATIRRTSRRLDKTTDSSYRFERGVDPHRVVDALHRATELIHELAGGNITKGLIDVRGPLPQQNPITVRVERVNQILGAELNARDVADVLVYLGFQLTRSDREKLTLLPPSHRMDISREIDLIEEVGRIHGYHKIKAQMPYVPARAEVITPQERITRTLKDVLRGAGLNEVITFSFVSREALNALGLPADRLIEVTNPLSRDQEVMRPSLVPGLIRTVQHNQSHGQPDVMIFEAGRVYEAGGNGEADSGAVERRWLSAAVVGNVSATWQRGSVAADFYTVKGLAEQCLRALGLEGWEVKRLSDLPYYHPHRAAQLIEGEAMLARFGELHPALAAELDVRGRLLMLEIPLETLVERLQDESAAVRRMKPIPRFPAVQRDIAILVDAAIPAGEIAEAIERAGGELVESARLFDVYEGEKIQKGKKSLAFSITCRSTERTLTDEEVAATQERILAALGEQFGAQLRS